MAELTNHDDSIGGPEQMDTLIALISEAENLSSTAEELVVASLMATPASMLKRFSHSAALNRVDEWLTRSSSNGQPARNNQLLALLGRMPMSITALGSSGIGKTVNKLRKSSDASVQGAALALVKEWKALPPPTAAPAPAPALAAAPKPAAPAPAVKRPLSSDGAAAADKRAKVAPSGKSLNADDDSLDSALSAQAAPRKASIKPDHLKNRRPVKPMSLTPNVPSAPSAASKVASTSASVGSGSMQPPPAPQPLGRVASNESTASTADETSPAPRPTKAVLNQSLSFETTSDENKRKFRKRVTWASAKELVEERTYTVAAKEGDEKRTARDFQGALSAELQGEKQAQQALRGGAAPIDVSGPQARIPWKVPPLLDEMYWPAVKGDMSTERDVQRKRRASVPEVTVLNEQPVPPAEPGPMDNFPSRDESMTPLMPLETVSAPAPSSTAPILTSIQEPAAQAPVAAAGGVGGSLEVMMLQNLMAGFSGNTVAAGAMANAPSGVDIPPSVGIQSGISGGLGASASGGLPGLGGGGGLPGLGGGSAGAAGGSAGTTMTEKLALQMALQNASTGRMMPQTGQAFGGNRFQAGGNRFQAGGMQGNMRAGGGGPGMPPITAEHHNYRTKACRYFQSGMCKNGDNCTFLHSKDQSGGGGQAGGMQNAMHNGMANGMQNGMANGMQNAMGMGGYANRMQGGQSGGMGYGGGQQNMSQNVAGQWGAGMRLGQQQQQQQQQW